MRFLLANHLRLGILPTDVPSHLPVDIHSLGPAAVWRRIVATAKHQNVHAVLLCGETIASANPTLEPWGPLADGIRELSRAGIPVIAIASGNFTPQRMQQVLNADPVHWIDDTLAWDPPLTTSVEPLDVPAIYVVAGDDVSPEALIDGSILIKHNGAQPKITHQDGVLVVSPGSTSPLATSEPGAHGVWLIDTDASEATFSPIAPIEFTALAIDISAASDLQEVEQEIVTATTSRAQDIHDEHRDVATAVCDVAVTGATSLFGQLPALFDELERLLIVQQYGITAGINSIQNDATPQIELEQLVERPDPVGEVARLIRGLDGSRSFSEAQQRLLGAAERRLTTVNHARVFGAIADEQITNTATELLRREAWSVLSALLDQRGID